MRVDPLGTKKLPSDDVPRQMLPLLVELPSGGAGGDDDSGAGGA